MTKRIKLLLVALSIGSLLQGAPSKFFYQETFPTPTTIGEIDVSWTTCTTYNDPYVLQISTPTYIIYVFSKDLSFVFEPLEFTTMNLSLFTVRPGTDKLIKTDKWTYTASVPEPTAMGLIMVGGLGALLVNRIRRNV